MLTVSSETPQGQGYDLSPHIEGLTWSNTKHGGDETASFTLKRSWLTSNPEVTKGSIVRICDGLDVLWQGRIEEVDRSAEDTESLEVTCYGLGARLKDDLFRMIFIDRDFESWGGMSRARRIEIGQEPSANPEVLTDTTNGLPALKLPLIGAWNTTHRTYAAYDCGADLTWAQVLYEGQRLFDDANMSLSLYSEDSDTGVPPEGSGDVSTGATFSGSYTPATPRRYALWELLYSGAGGLDRIDYSVFLRHIALLSTHGLSLVGDSTETYGFTADQLIGWMVGRVPGIVQRELEAQPFVIKHFVVDTPSTHEDGIAAANEYAGACWGTWGPESVFDRSTDGYFDYRRPEDGAEWIVSRADADDLDLHDELGSLFDKLKISYQDSSGEEHVEERTAYVPALAEANMSPRTQELDIGPGTQSDAQRVGDVFFALQGTDPPSRGSITLGASITHCRRGPLPPHYMRADGAALKVPDVLPHTEAISLDHVDRRTVFPIQRVNVDASGAVPRVTVDLDQTSDRLSVLQARLGLAAGAMGGGSVAGGTGAPASSAHWHTRVSKGGRPARRKRGGKARK